ncbi:MAG: ribonuclease HII, partial [Chloroflexi bacterium]|nr:ribonuclease HII [Chloroflexota bacterium]
SAAQRLAASRALGSPVLRPDAALLDGRWDFVSPPVPSGPRREGFQGPVRTVIGGDARCVSLAAASILAKVWRDDHMVQQASQYPAYDFDRNKGYPCPRHRAALAAWGPSAIHRRSWAFMDHLPCGAPVGAPPVTQPRLPEHR